jgi:hypothetical protein
LKEFREQSNTKQKPQKISDIANIKGSPLEEESNHNAHIKAPERDPSVLKSLDYTEHPVILEEEDDNPQVPKELRKDCHPYTNMYSGKFSRNSIFIPGRNSSKPAILQKAPFPVDQVLYIFGFVLSENLRP